MTPEYRRAYYKKNKEKMNAQHRAWREANREKNRAIKKVWRDNNPEQWLAICKNNNTRRKRVIARQVISKYYTKELLAIYENCPPGYEVDHIVPLRGKSVSGLHVPWNLQYLLSEVNRKKANKLDR